MNQKIAKLITAFCFMLIISQAGCDRGLVVDINAQDSLDKLPTPTIAPFFLKPGQNTFPTAQIEPIEPVTTAAPSLPGISETPTAEIAPMLTANVNVNRDVHPISELIYGVSDASLEILEDLQPTLNSWGGSPSSRYNWKLGNAWNAGRDSLYANGDYGFLEGNASDLFFGQAREAGISTRLSYPALGWVAKDTNPLTCSFLQADGTCGDADGASCRNPGAIANPRTANEVSDPTFVTDWMKYLSEEQDYTLEFLAFDHEPELWGYTHYDVHPTCTTYEEILTKYLEYADAIHLVAPEAELSGPTTSGWNYYWNSMAGDQDKALHDNQDFLPWFLDNVRQHDETEGWRSLSVLDIHFYPERVYNDKVDNITSALRLRSTRLLWDTTYTEEGSIGQPVYLIPRMQEMIEEHYPGTKLGISEWNWGAENSMNGALAIADVLGIFGRVDLFYAAYWTHPPADSHGYNAFKLYTNYDGNGSRFGDTSVWSETTDSENVTSYAALDSDTGDLHLMMINKNPTDEMITQVNLQGFTPQPTARVYRYEETQQKGIALSSLSDVSSNFNLSLPPYSITLVVFRPQVP